MQKSKKKFKLALVSLPVNEYRFSLIGLVAIATYIDQNMKDVEVKVIDNAFENISKKLSEFQPDLIGLSTFTAYYYDTINFAKKVKEKNPLVKIVVGGPHINSEHDSLDKIFDAGVIGEGEKTLLELINTIRKGKNFDNIPGVIFHKNGRLKINKKRELDSILKLKLNYKFLHKDYFKKRFLPETSCFGVAMGIMSSLGCPFNCRFCAIRSCWDKIRFREAREIVNEIKDLYYNYGVRHMDFFDDLFSVNKKRLNEIYDLLKKDGLIGKISFACQARANMMDDEIGEIFQKLNMVTVMFGFESGSDRVLKYIKNDLSLSVDINKRAISVCQKYGLNVYGSLMMGIPGEKLDDMQKTINFINFGKKHGVGRLWTQVLVPMPGTEMWEIVKERGKLQGDMYSGKITMHSQEKPLLLDSDVSYKEFLKKYNIATKKCRSFVYKLVLKTIRKNPLSIFYFAKDFFFYLKRTINFLKHKPIN